MRTKRLIILGAVGLAGVALVAYAGNVVTKTFRTTGFFFGITQGTNVTTGNPVYREANFAGHNLVNLAMGRSPNDTSDTNQVMAMTFACDLSSASLVVYDKSSSNVVATIATSTAIDAVRQQDPLKTGPDRAHFVAVLQIGPNGSATDGLAGGYFTVAGRVHLNPTTGCPMPVLVGLDRDPWDRLDGDIEVPASFDKDPELLVLRTGLAHLIGVVDAVTGGETNTVLVPNGFLSIRRELP